MIYSVTLCDNREALVGDALLSVLSVVDFCLVIDTGITDRSLDVAREVCGERLRTARFNWVGSFSAARNFALDEAYRQGASLAVMLDTDERYEWNGDTPTSIDAPVLLVRPQGASYAKEHIFKLPRKFAYEGPTHEAYPSAGAQVLPRARTWEVPKTEEGVRVKLERDLAILEPYCKAHPKEARWHFYRGQTLKELGRKDDAISAYFVCAKLRTWDEESAWACFECAKLCVELDDFPQAFDYCLEGLERHAGFGELHWYAGYCQYRLGHFEQALYWARSSIALGCYQGIGKTIQRFGFRHLPGLYENPYDLLHWSLKALGRRTEADEVLSHHRAARELRLLETGLS